MFLDGIFRFVYVMIQWLLMWYCQKKCGLLHVELTKKCGLLWVLSCNLNSVASWLMKWVKIHEVSGSNSSRDKTLGDFFSIWVSLGGQMVLLVVGGNRYLMELVEIRATGISMLLTKRSFSVWIVWTRVYYECNANTTWFTWSVFLY